MKLKFGKAIFLLVISFCACNDQAQKSSKSYRYQIEQISLNNKVKCVVSVRIGNIYDFEEMKELSGIIKSKVNCISDHLYISYLMPDMQHGAGAWAVAEYNPDFKIQVFGKIKQNFSDLKLYVIDSSNTYLGHWIDLGTQDDLMYRIKKTNNNYSLELCSPSEKKESELSPLRKSKRNGKEIFIDMAEQTQYYIINHKGNLEAYDNYGWIVTYQKYK